MADPSFILNALFPLTKSAYGTFLLVFLKFKYLAQAPSILFSKLSFAISIPNIKDNFELTHFGKSPAFPHAKSIKISPGLEIDLINNFFTYKL